jgi:hypothetical protein
MQTDTNCSECGTELPSSRTCEDDFHQMLFWEAQDPSLATVHHLVVLCYHLQHPSLYSREGLEHAIKLLADFLDGGLTPQEARWRQRIQMDSGERTWKVTGSEDSHGVYTRPVEWLMTARDVVRGGRAHYLDSVLAWAHKTLEDLRSSGNYDPT